ncbi:MAG: tRNA uridine-5-carboxymethylaminomethyl(34) synthesis GTPase MnmE [Desulfobacterales bacterium]|nr:tRNA uridine-5-carboxymethylaminomethyl(34) synthesis GTPase MnmE [Desulfobacterales bacterium]
MIDTTIAAIATPIGYGGIGIIKISGSSSLNIGISLFQKNNFDLNNKFIPISHHFYHGYIVNPETKKIIDEVLFVYMKSPFSYTKEDVVEIHGHSGPFVLQIILNLILKMGATLAEPGEFTKRAFLNGRIDLTQAEGVIDIINSQSIKSLYAASSQVNGVFKDKILSIKNIFEQILTEIEASIDFSSDIEIIVENKELLNIIEKDIFPELSKLVIQYENAHFLKEGLKIAIAGRPNVGKSTLMNCLLKQDRSIVTPIPGTTRDIIQEMIFINGISIILSDTAGIHETSDYIENIGINKAKECIENSDLVLFIIEAQSNLIEKDFKIYNEIKNNRLIIVINKIDLWENDFVLPSFLCHLPHITVSARFNKGIDDLMEIISNIMIKDIKYENNYIIPNLRHKLLIEQCIKSAKDLIQGLNHNISHEFIAIHINEAIKALNNILGETADFDVLDNIFSRFCIGK